MFHSRLLLTCEISIARDLLSGFTIRTLYRLGIFMGLLSGFAIAFVVSSLDPSGAFRGWCAVRTLQPYFSNRFLT